MYEKGLLYCEEGRGKEVRREERRKRKDEEGENGAGKVPVQRDTE